MRKAKTVASRKAKGRRLQNWVRDQLLKLSSSFHPDDVKSTPMGVQGEDIQLSYYVRSLLPIQIECKNVSDKRIPLQSYMEQARNHGKHNPVVFVKQPYKTPVAIVDAEFFMDLLKEKVK